MFLPSFFSKYSTTARLTFLFIEFYRFVSKYIKITCSSFLLTVYFSKHFRTPLQARSLLGFTESFFEILSKLPNTKPIELDLSVSTWFVRRHHRVGAAQSCFFFGRLLVVDVVDDLVVSVTGDVAGARVRLQPGAVAARDGRAEPAAPGTGRRRRPGAALAARPAAAARRPLAFRGRQAKDQGRAESQVDLLTEFLPSSFFPNWVSAPVQSVLPNCYSCVYQTSSQFYFG